jgi:DNA-binding MarR family transcriptional regulator
MSENTESELVINIINLQSKIQKQVGGALSVHGIGLSEYLVLNQLFIAPTQKMRRSDLAERVGLSPSGITRLLNPMEKIGLVQKEENPRDARVSLVTISETGKQIYKDAQVSFNHASSALFKPLDSEQLSDFSGLLKAVSSL